MSYCINVSRESADLYDIYITEGFQELAGLLAPFLSDMRKVCIVSDSNVAPLYKADVENIVKDLGCKSFSFTFPAGEESKNLDTVQDLYEYLVKSKFERRDVLLALGGGVVGDLTGFAAATYLRGIKFIQLPTTLLAQTDSSIGGKTGVDFRGLKNMIGAFNDPSLVYMNMTSLETLDKRQFLAGLGEVIKTAMIKDADFYDYILKNRDKIKNRNGEVTAELVYKSCLVKAGVVERDPKEKGERAILNFGHTLGHAIEKCAEFKILHGECVVIGMVCALYISKKRGMISEEDYKTAVDMFNYLGYGLDISYLNADDIIEATRSDKKMEAGSLKFILLDGIGNAVIVRDVSEAEMREALSVVGL